MGENAFSNQCLGVPSRETIVGVCWVIEQQRIRLFRFANKYFTFTALLLSTTLRLARAPVSAAAQMPIETFIRRISVGEPLAFPSAAQPSAPSAALVESIVIILPCTSLGE